MNWCISIHELYLLGGIMQVSSFLGLEDPFPGFQMEEIQECMETARQSLIDRGYLSQTDEGFELDSDLLNSVQTISEAPKVVVASKDQSSILIHSMDDYIVKQETISNDSISLTTILDWDEAKNHLVIFFPIPETSAAPGPGFSVNASAIEAAKGIFQNGVQDNALVGCKQLLTEKGIPIEATEALAITLSGRNSTGSLMVFDREKLTLHPQGGFAWLTGTQGTWKVDLPPAEDVETMKWTPISSTSLIDAIESFIGSI